MASSWHIVGWVDKTRYLESVKTHKYQIRFQDKDRIIVRIPPTVGRDLSWQILERVPNCTTNDQWLSIPRSTAVLRRLLLETLSPQRVRSILSI